ncbi:hypothetical protein B0J17DRAFT_682538 [Rhizoctonia solani]|nr:hypothetical protein B0J17DRAFT_682538 [Rhizoctonia solani]
MDLTRTQSINLLPVEILAHVFVLVCAAYPCPWVTTPTSVEEDIPMSILILLSHVCSHWRRVAIATSGLWTHVDIDPSRVSKEQLPIRTRTYLARSSEQSVDIHIIYSALDDLPSPTAQRILTQFFTDIAPRTRGVTVKVSDWTTGQDFCVRVISNFLSTCISGALTQFAMKLASSPRDDRQALTEQIEPILEVFGPSITALRLEDFYPKWTSKLYCGLTELRMNGYGSIAESALLAILKLSPMLRALEVQIDVTDPSPIHVSVDPVILEDLEVLILECCQLALPPILMRIVQPGPKPLTLWIGYSAIRSILRHRSSSGGSEVIKRFFASSNITRLLVSHLDDYVRLANLLTLTPKVRVLALVVDLFARIIEDESALPPPLVLDALYLVCSRWSPNSWLVTETIVRRHRSRALTLWRIMKSGAYPDNLFTVCPQVTIVPLKGPNPIEAWV